MPERASVTQGIQIGPETTPGTLVPAGKLLNYVTFEPGIQLDVARFKPQGQKFLSAAVPGREWTGFGIRGQGSYSELVYLLCGILHNVSPTTVATTGRKWSFVPAARAEDTVKTFSIEQGGAVRAHRFAYGLITELGIEFTRMAVNITGSGIAQRLEDNIVMTGSPASIQEKPILPGQIDVYMDTTSAGLGTTKLTRNFRAQWNVGDRFNPVWPLNSALVSFGAHVEGDPSWSLQLQVAADAQGMGILPILRAGETRYLRIAATSPDNAGTGSEPYKAWFDFAAKVVGVSPFEDTDGVYAISYTWEPVFDSVWGGATKQEVVNQVAAL